MSDSFEMRRIRHLDTPDVLSLFAKSDAYLSSLYPPESNNAESIEALSGENSVFFGAYVSGQLAALGGVKIFANATPYGEIKRVFVEEQHRGKSLASAVMQSLEDYLRANEIMIVRLEAGPVQPEALGLYRKLGYIDRGPFGRYKADPLSVFMEKHLQA